ncbi:conserved hypothetical protein [Candidatus Karelsulcia muelleri CARI]|uniref:DUF3127 domain-containing protein n=2 Tax=cellular organisms TaxID=131567 RepID=E0TJN0_KARMC|nr:conserved hypothetical protein [Candidatus Karelsulcia muelleri CARI]
MEIIGLVKTIFSIQVLKNGFKKREILVFTEEQYPQNLLIEFIQDKIKLLDSIKIEDRIKIFINLKGRKWTTPNGSVKYFNSIQGWKIEKIVNKKNISSSKTDVNEFDDFPF